MALRPNPKDIATFGAYDVGQFARWLRAGLEGYLVNKTGVGSFRPLWYCMLQEHSLFGDLENIYDDFSAPQKAMIRQAVVLLLKELPVEQKYEPVFGVLLDFAAAISAVDVLSSIPARGEGFLILEPVNQDTPSLYSRALHLVVNLANPIADARPCIERLIGASDSFSCDDAWWALIGLCRVAPEEFVKHVGLLRGHLVRNLKKWQPTEQGQLNLAGYLVSAVGPDRIKADLPVAVQEMGLGPADAGLEVDDPVSGLVDMFSRLKKVEA